MKRRVFNRARWFAALAIASLAIGFPAAFVSAIDSRLWFYPGGNFGVDPDHYVIVRCGSGAQNLFWIPVEPILFFSVLIPLAWLLRKVGRFLRELRENFRAARLDAELARIRDFERRKICINCGYDLRAPGRCPECGIETKLPAGAR